MFGADDKVKAETAAAAAADMLAATGSVAPPPASDAIATLVFQALRDRGWIQPQK